MSKINETKDGHSVSLENCKSLAYPGFLDFKQKMVTCFCKIATENKMIKLMNTFISRYCQTNCIFTLRGSREDRSKMNSQSALWPFQAFSLTAPLRNYSERQVGFNLLKTFKLSFLSFVFGTVEWVWHRLTRLLLQNSIYLFI